MDEKRQRMGALGWTGLALALLVLYVLSFGPACWIVERGNMNGALISVIYRPVIQFARRSSRVERIALWYAAIGAEKWSPMFDATGISWWIHTGSGGSSTFTMTISDTFCCDTEEESAESEASREAKD